MKWTKLPLTVSILLISLLLVSCGGSAQPAEQTGPSGGEGPQQTAEVTTANILDSLAGQISELGSETPATTPASAETTAAPETTQSGGVIDTGTTWPDNEYTAAVPFPDIGTLIRYAVTEDGGFSADFKNVEIEKARDYVKALKEAGFTQNAEDDDSSVTDNALSVDFIRYMADNGTYRAGIAYVMNIVTVKVEKK